ncbi:hypothetical protein Q1695_008119 [Nippostrongylus brasiliensis]|nr:hypothetical protein Q1695_008119 [Nippostrongylus brasiliensis]
MVIETESLTQLLPFIEWIHITVDMFVVILAALLLIVSTRVKVFHENLNALMQFAIAFIGFSFLTRLLLAVCEIGGLQRESEFGRIVFAVVGSIWSTFAYASVFVVVSIAIERGFATYYLSDYERRSRSAIRVALLVLIIVTSTILGVLDWKYDITVYDLPSMIVIVISSATGYLFLYSYNRKMLKKLPIDRTEYSLSLRYQLEENLRVFRVMRYLYLNAVISLLFILGILYILTQCIEAECRRAVMEVYDLTVSVASCAFFILCAVTIQRWRKELRKMLNCPAEQRQNQVAVAIIPE